METDEVKLIDAARHGDHAAFGKLVKKHQRKVYAVALGVLRDPDAARDACQDAFLKVHKGLAAFDGSSQFYTWLYRIVVNRCIDYLRQRRVDCTELDPQGLYMAPQLESDPSRSLADKELRARLERASACLSPTHRTVVTLREVNGLAYKEIAAVMGTSIGTVMSRLFHARKNLQVILADDRDALALAA
jgi:RNA polymerase sigma-70 factor, ECF subfamily